jgi:hypothetical protein
MDNLTRGTPHSIEPPIQYIMHVIPILPHSQKICRPQNGGTVQCEKKVQERDRSANICLIWDLP